MSEMSACRMRLQATCLCESFAADLVQNYIMGYGVPCSLAWPKRLGIALARGSGSTLLCCPPRCRAPTPQKAQTAQAAQRPSTRPSGEWRDIESAEATLRETTSDSLTAKILAGCN